MFLGILGLVVVAFIGYWLFLAGAQSGPVRAQAATTDPVKPPPASPAALGSVAPSIPQPSLASRLAATAAARDLDPEAVRNVFLPSESWLSQGAKGQPAASLQASSTQDFLRKHQLTSVILSGAGGSVTIGNRVVQVGQEVDGYRLISLTQDSATFRCGDDVAELKLESVAGQANP